VKVFISHSFQDMGLAKRVGDALRKAGIDAWDATLVLPGANWGDDVGRALRRSSAMVVLLTPESVRSANVSYDVGYAIGELRFKGRVIPVLAAAPGDLAETRGAVPWVLNFFPMVQLADPGHPEAEIGRIAQLLARAA
jgi:hypothetical protein